MYLETLEHHCKFSEPGLGLLKSLKEILLIHTAKKQQQEGEGVGGREDGNEQRRQITLHSFRRFVKTTISESRLILTILNIL